MSWLLQSILYCSYNMLLLVPVLVNLKRFIKSKKQIIYISVISSIILFILAISIYLLLINVDVNFSSLEMPAVYVISTLMPKFKAIYGIVILLSIFTTAISDGIAFLENVCKSKASRSYYPQLAAIMCITSVIISNVGFSNLVKNLFTLFGYFGFSQLVPVLFFTFG